MEERCEGISQLRDLMSSDRFAEIILAGINTAERVLDLGDQALAAGDFAVAEEMWTKAWSNFQWIALNIIQRRLRVGKSEGGKVGPRLRKFWMRMMTFGAKKKVARAKVAAV
jgi:hypothetical protein